MRARSDLHLRGTLGYSSSIRVSRLIGQFHLCAEGTRCMSNRVVFGQFCHRQCDGKSVSLSQTFPPFLRPQFANHLSCRGSHMLNGHYGQNRTRFALRTNIFIFRPSVYHCWVGVVMRLALCPVRPITRRAALFLGLWRPIVIAIIWLARVRDCWSPLHVVFALDAVSIIFTRVAT